MGKSLRRRLRQIDRAKILSAEDRARLILDDRTERLASRPTGRAAPSADAFQVLVCEAGEEHYGIALDAVAEVMPFQPCMPVPDGPPALVGLFGRGGRLISVIDLAAALGDAAPAPAGENQHLVLLRREQPRVALRIDRALGVSAATWLDGHDKGGFRKEAVTGYAEAEAGFSNRERVLSLLDVDRLLRPFLPHSPDPGV